LELILLPKICAFFVMISIIIVFRTYKRDVRRMHTIFVRSWMVGFVSILLDMVRSFLILYKGIYISRRIISIINDLYFISLMSVLLLIVSYQLYSYLDRETFIHHMRIKSAEFIVFALVIIGLQEKNVYFNLANRNVYVPMAITNFYIVMELLLVIVEAYRHRHRNSRYKWYGIISTAIGIQVAVILQTILNDFKMYSFLVALAIMILYIVNDDPSGDIEPDSGFIKIDALTKIIDLKYAKNEEFSLMFINFMNINNAPYYEKIIDNTREIENFLSTFSKNIIVSKNSNLGYNILINDKEDLFKVYEAIRDRFSQPFGRTDRFEGIYIEPTYVICKEASVASSSDELSKAFRYKINKTFKFNNISHLEVTESDVADIREEDSIIAQIQEAMLDNRVEVFYQPIYSIKKKTFVSAEALIRIRQKNGELLPPARFIPVAENTGLISRLGECVFEKTCAFIRNFHPEFYGIENIEINLSVVQCSDKYLADDYLKIMKFYNINPKLVNFEITESASILSKGILAENMQKLIKEGVSFSLDDYGTGESNLNYVVDMPIHNVKFDKDMTKAFFCNKKANKLYKASINIFHEIGLSTISEGVESFEEMLLLEKAGTDKIQGFYFAKPMPEYEFIKFISENYKNTNCKMQSI